MVGFPAVSAVVLAHESLVLDAYHGEKFLLVNEAFGTVRARAGGFANFDVHGVLLLRMRRFSLFVRALGADRQGSVSSCHDPAPHFEQVNQYSARQVYNLCGLAGDIKRAAN